MKQSFNDRYKELRVCQNCRQKIVTFHVVICFSTPRIEREKERKRKRETGEEMSCHSDITLHLSVLFGVILFLCFLCFKYHLTQLINMLFKYIN